jgi:signal transduction histidine kinase
VFVTVPACFVALAIIATPLPDSALSEALVLALVVSRPAGWFALAAYASIRGETMPWARRSAPLFFGMGIAESFRGIDPDGFGAWTLAGVLMCACIAGLGARAAMIDLDEAVRREEHELDELSGALTQASHTADDLQRWREQFTHDARSTVAGLRAALDVLEQYDGQADRHAAQRLHLVAVHEIAHLEHLLTRSRSQALEVFDAAEVVREVSGCARALGAEVSVHVRTATAWGRAGDLAAVLKALLVNARTHAPGSRVELRVVRTADVVRITCTDDGPGLQHCDAEKVFDRGYRGDGSSGSGLGLFAARQLMREQGGDIELGPGPGATFVVTVRAATVPTRAVTHAVPLQRTGSASGVAAGAGRA